MLPLLLAAIPAEVDTMASVSAQASGIAGTIGETSYSAVLASVNPYIWTRIAMPRATFVFDFSGRYGRAAATSGAPLRPDDLAVRTSSLLNWVTSPRTNLSFGAGGMMASRLGLRAPADLEVRDPFITNRVIYGFAGQTNFATVLSPRGSLRFHASYAQAGAVSADVPEAVGIDTHAFVGSLAGMYQLAPRLRLGPLMTFGFTHFYHALLDVHMTRGEAQVASFSLLGTARWEISPRSMALAFVGLNASSPPPIVKEATTVINPDARFEVRHFRRGIGGTAGVSFGYRSLGPRIGFGVEQAAYVDGWMRPFSGAKYRDVLGHVVARVRRGTAPLAAVPVLGSAVPNRPSTGHFTTDAFSLGLTMVGPIRPGWLVNAGLDLEFVSAKIDPAPPVGAPLPAFRALLMVGLTAISSTEPLRRLPRDPLPAGEERVPTVSLETPPGATLPPMRGGDDPFGEDEGDD